MHVRPPTFRRAGVRYAQPDPFPRLFPVQTATAPATRVQFGTGATLRYSSTPSLRAAEFEDSLSAVAQSLCCHPLNVGLASEARSTTMNRRRRKDDDENENEGPGKREMLTWWAKG